MPAWRGLVHFLAGVLMLTGGVVLLVLWDATVVYHGGSGARELGERTLAQAWRALSRPDRFDDLDAIWLAIPIGCVAYVCLAVFAFLVDAYRCGPVRPALRRLACAATMSLWLIMLIVMSGGVLVVLLHHAELRAASPRWFPNEADIASLAAIPLTACAVLSYLARLARAIPSETPDALGPLCERCGYDLTHRPDGGRCPECGLELGLSPAPLTRRTLCAWENRADMFSFLGTALAVVTAPGRFYAALRLRTPFAASYAFARWNFVLVALVAQGWIQLMFEWEGDSSSPSERLAISLVTGAMIVLAAMCTHRAVGAVAFLAALYGGALRDFGWLRKVFCYESAFVWVLCVFNGVFFSSFLLWGEWISTAVGRAFVRRTLGAGKVEPFVLFFGSLAICAAWLLRYRRIVAAIRWSNH